MALIPTDRFCIPLPLPPGYTWFLQYGSCSDTPYASYAFAPGVVMGLQIAAAPVRTSRIASVGMEAGVKGNW